VGALVPVQSKAPGAAHHLLAQKRTMRGLQIKRKFLNCLLVWISPAMQTRQKRRR